MFDGFSDRPRQRIEFFVPGKPRPKDFKVVRYGNEPNAATGIRATKEAEEYIRKVEEYAQVAVAIYGEWEVPNIEIPVRLDLEIRLPIAKSWPSSKRVARLGRYASAKGDNDNIENCVFDALVGRVKKRGNSPAEQARKAERTNPILRDDSQIAINHTEKRWVEIGQEGLLVTVEVLHD